MNLNTRIYLKIVNHLRDKGGASAWDFRTLNLVYPQLCAKLIEILQHEQGFTREQLMKNYVPMKIESRG